MSAKPRGFIGSSREGLGVADKLLQCLADYADIKPWDLMVQPGKYVLESLAEELEKSQFGIFVFTPDDVLKLRQEEYVAVRDNVLFELGMFVGRLGRTRSFIVMPEGVKNFRIPADLLGVSVLYFNPQQEDLDIALGKACVTIRQQVRKIEVPGGGSGGAPGPDEGPKPGKRPKKKKPPTIFEVH
jgi:predicted nucleotide-binding protein